MGFNAKNLRSTRIVDHWISLERYVFDIQPRNNEIFKKMPRIIPIISAIWVIVSNCGNMFGIKNTPIIENENKNIGNNFPVISSRGLWNSIKFTINPIRKVPALIK